MFLATTRDAQSARTWEQAPMHTGEIGKHIIQETTYVVHPQNVHVKFDIAQKQNHFLHPRLLLKCYKMLIRGVGSWESPLDLMSAS